MQDAADALKASLTDLENALNEGNLSDARPAASASHENYHELDHMISPFLADETPAPEATEAPSGSATATAAPH